MYTIAIVGQKGGTGKDDPCGKFGRRRYDARHSVALMDLDPQITATNWGDRRKSEPPTVVSCQVARLGFVLSEAQRTASKWFFLTAPVRCRSNDCSRQGRRSVLIPIQPIINDIQTLPAFRDLLRVTGDKPAVVVVNNAPIQGDRHIHAHEAAEQAGFTVCPIVLFHRAAVYDSPLPGLAVQEYEPDGKAAQEFAQLYKYTATLLHNNTGTQDEQTKAQLSSSRA